MLEATWTDDDRCAVFAAPRSLVADMTGAASTVTKPVAYIMVSGTP